MFRCPIFCVVFQRSRQKPFVRRSSLQAQSLLLLLLSLSGWWWVKCALSLLALTLKILLGKTSRMINNSSLAKDFFIYTFSKTWFHIPYLHGRLFRRWNFHRKNSQLVMIMWSSHIYRYSALHLHCDLVNPLYSLFLWFLWSIPLIFVIFVIYRLDFVHLSILWSS